MCIYTTIRAICDRLCVFLQCLCLFVAFFATIFGNLWVQRDDMTSTGAVLLFGRNSNAQLHEDDVQISPGVAFLSQEQISW